MPKIEGDLADALKLLHDYFGQKGIPFALIGALVPAILLSSEIGVRETRDADHVIKLSSWVEWETVIADPAQLGFRQSRGEQEHRLHYRTAEIDLIPYGITTGPDDVLVWRRSGSQMNMAGFSEVFEHALPIEIVKGLTLPVIPLWLFAALKIVAYLDRKFPRDLRDLVYVLEHYESLGNRERRFETIGEVSGVTYENAGAYLLGADIRAKVSPNALNSVRDFLAPITEEYHSIINTALREESSLASDRRRTFVYQLIQTFRLGLRDQQVAPTIDIRPTRP